MNSWGGPSLSVLVADSPFCHVWLPLDELPTPHRRERHHQVEAGGGRAGG